MGRPKAVGQYQERSKGLPDFIWGLPIQPFGWISQDGQEYLTDRQVGRPAWIQTYRPLVDHTGLFKILAKVNPAKSEILDFAKKYGCLLGGQGDLIRTTDEFGNELFVHGETLVFWQGEITAMA